MIHINDQKQIAKWETKHQDDHKLKIVTSPDHRSQRFVSFAAELSEIASSLDIETHKEDDGLGYIGIDGRLKYQAIPQDHELTQFLAALAYVKKAPNLSERILNIVGRITAPSSLILFITPQCPHCPVLVRQIIPIIFSTPLLTLTVIDGMMFPEMAKTYDVKSVPSLFFGQ